MTRKALRNTFLTGLLAVLSAACLLNTTQGGKPSGGGGGDTGGGTIYFVRNPGGFSTMDSNGGSKTSLGINPGEPSYALHGGQRWFLQTRQLPGEFYPNGSTRRELFAVSGDGGQAVQLTDQPSLEVRGQVRGYHWTPGDEAVSWTARRWDVSTGNVVEGGIYGAGISFGADGPVLLAQPANPLLPVELIVTQGSWEAYEDGPTLAPNVNTHSWSPLAVFVVYDLLDWQARESWIADPVTGAEFQLSANGVHPEWSPDGGKIAFDGFLGDDGIHTINPDGTGETAIIRSTATVSFYGARWSPTGSHLTYHAFDHWSKPSDPLPGLLYVYRASATGGGKTNLTKDSSYAYPVGWR
jgi:hypothetical protein